MKAAKAWAVYGDDGKILIYTISAIKYEAKRKMGIPDKTTKQSWKIFKKRGYRCQRVEITPVKTEK